MPSRSNNAKLTNIPVGIGRVLGDRQILGVAAPLLDRAADRGASPDREHMAPTADPYRSEVEHAQPTAADQ